MGYGSGWDSSRVITNEPPLLGAPFAVLVPRVNADGNDQGGLPLPETAAPLGTYTGWNVSLPPLPDLASAGLADAFEPFARTRRDRERDPRRAPVDRRALQWTQGLSQPVSQAAEDRAATSAPEDVRAVLRRADAMWTAIVDAEPPQ